MPKMLLDLSAKDLQNYPAEKTLIFIPLGTLQRRGPHLPIGLDLLESQAILKTLAKKAEEQLHMQVLLFPPLPLSVESGQAIGSLAFRNTILDLCMGLAKMNFKYFFCFSPKAGPKQRTVFEEIRSLLSKKALLLLRKRVHFIALYSEQMNWKKYLSFLFKKPPEEHGGEKDTSLALFLKKTTVSTSYQELPPNPPAKSFWKRLWRTWFQKKAMHYFGNPAIASIEKGKELFQQNIRQLFPMIEYAIDPTHKKKQNRFWTPFHHSLFKYWLSAILTLLLIYGWLLWITKPWLLGV